MKKLKLSSQKSDNTFKFESFGERIARVRVSSLLNAIKGHALSEDSDECTHFSQTIRKWIDLNCTQDFEDLRKSIGSEVTFQSLPQIILRKDEIIAVLVDGLRRPNNGAVNVVLELVVALARDLQPDFYEHFNDIFSCLVPLIDTTDAELIENVFICIAFLFKYLWRQIIRDFREFFQVFAQKLLRSPKDYIRTFASESVSYLIRKSSNKENMINILFESAIRDDLLKEGVSRVLFESIKGVNKQMHSSADTFLSLVIDYYLTFESDCLDPLLSCFMELLINFISIQNSDMIWNVLLIDLNIESKKYNFIKKIVPLLKLIIGYKKCSLVNNTSKLIEYLTNCLSYSLLTTSTKQDILNCIQQLMYYKHQYVFANELRVIHDTIYFSNFLTINEILEFTRNMFKCCTFERNILPTLLKYCAAFMKKDNILLNEFNECVKLLTQLVMTKCQRPVLGYQLKSISKYILKCDDFEDMEQTFLHIIETSNDIKLIWCALVCLPHITPISDELRAISSIVFMLTNRNHQFECQQNPWMAFVLMESITSIILLKSGKSIIHEISKKDVINLLIKCPSDVNILQALDLYLTYNKENSKDVNKELDSSDLIEMYPILALNLWSYCRIKRLCSIHILTLFDHLFNYTDISPDSSIFNICLRAELVPPTVQEYRNKIKYLQNLDYLCVQQFIPLLKMEGINLDLMPIYYLLGTLYENLSLLWQPIFKIIEGYAKNSSNKRFIMELLFSHLNNTIEYIYNKKSINDISQDIKEFLNTDLDLFNSFDERPDHLNHRILILNAMELFPETIEQSNRQFLNIFMTFIEKDMNVCFKNGMYLRENISISENNHLIDDNLNECQTSTIEDNYVISKRFLYKTLFSFLNIISKFKNPKALYREAELLELLLYLMSFPDAEVQKRSFNCILTYNHTYLNLCRENFLRLIDEKTFKSEIYAFIDFQNENNILQTEHRSNVVPLLMRILYGKMISSNGTKTHGKNNSVFRRSLILKVISVFNENELMLFMNLIFAPIQQLLELSYSEMHASIEEMVDIKNFIPLRQFQSLVTTLQFILKHFGNKTTEITSYLYKVLIVISFLVTHLLSQENRHLLRQSSISRLKNVRTNCFKIVIFYFKMLDHYPYSSVEIDVLFESLIWPMLAHLNIESVSSPSSLLKLLTCWSENPRYINMLCKRPTISSDLNKSTPIDVVISLYEKENVDQSVILLITTIIENLLTYENFSPIENENFNINEIIVNNIDEEFINRCKKDSQELNHGSILLSPYTSKILNRIQINFKNNILTKKKNNTSSLKELNILSRLSVNVTDSQECVTIIKLLIPFINSKKIDEEKEFLTLKAISQLTKYLPQTELKALLELLIPLFGRVVSRLLRTELCHVLQIMSDIDKNLMQITNVVIKINCYNPKFPEEPDFNARLEAFKTLNIMIENLDKVHIEYNNCFISLVLHNCCHFIRCCDDMAIRESSSNIIKNLTNVLSKYSEDLFHQHIIRMILFSEICSSFRHESETVRHEFIEILRAIIKHCSDKHTIIQHLCKITDNDQDMDFWSNITHIQLHRRARALSRLSRNDDLLKCFSNRVFTSFLIPLTTSFLFNKKYVKNPTLIDSAVEALGAFSKYIQWFKYESLLKYYIKLLINQKEDQKLVIKIISSILDNFEFNEKLVKNLKNDCSEGDSDANISINSKINNSIHNCLLPLLNQCLHQKSRIDFIYDAMKNEYPEDDDIQRIPLALAIIKLIKVVNCSQDLLESNLSSVFLRVCQFLRSHTESIRDTARNTLIKIIQCLGSKYFKYAFNEMRSSLSRGYQRHVFIYTIHAILSNMTDQLTCGDLDNCLTSLIEVCNLELFGSLSEEKDVTQITTKLKEARKCKSYDIYYILGSYVSKNYLMDLLSPLKTILLEANSHAVIKKITYSLNKIGFGLVNNKGIDTKTLILFIFEILEDSNSKILSKTEVKSELIEDKCITKPDCFLISIESIKRTEKKSKINEMSNLHILIEFALNTFYAFFKQNKITLENEENFTLFDQFIAILESVLDFKHTKVGTISLQCLYLLLTKFSSLPSLKSRSESIIGKIFILLNKYETVGSNNEQIALCFKIISLFIKDIICTQINENQMTALLSYVARDMFTDSKQSTSFLLLKAILSRRYESTELHKIIKKLFEICIKSETEYVRNNCRQIIVKYLTDYPQGNRLKAQINFFIKHLEYKELNGRESAAIVIKALISSLPQQYIISNDVVILIPLASRLVNEESANCKKIIADSIMKLLTILEESERTIIFDNIIIAWFQDNNGLQRLLAAHLCSIFIDIENIKFSKRISICLPLLNQQLHPDRYRDNEDNSNFTTKLDDNLAYQLLNLFLKIIRINSDIIEKIEWIEDFNSILNYIQSYYLLHPHIWIRIISAQLFGQIFVHYSTEQLANAINNESMTEEYMLHNTEEKLKQLSSTFILMFRDIYNSNILSDQLVKNLVYIARIILLAKDDLTIVEANERKDLTLKWMIKKLLFEIKYEIKNNATLFKKRICAFKWMAAISVELGNQRLENYLQLLMPALCREESTLVTDNGSDRDNENNQLLLLVKQILELIKSIIGSEKFSSFYTKSKTDITMKRLERKKAKAFEIVTNSMKSVKRKIDKHRNYTQVKRRRNEAFKK